jgi:hypothetical protein
MPAVVTHDFHRDEAVRSVTGSENLGFLLARSGAALAPKWWAHYADGVVEEINPADGHPRPDPDPAVRSKRVAIPPSIQTQDGLVIKHGSKFSGLIRRAVQCQYSRGLETKFSHLWSKTHGIIEYPQDREVGSTKGEEAVLLATRRQWVIEISAQGVFAAPLAIGADCRRCATDISNYLPTASQLASHPEWSAYASELSLAWAYANKNESGAVLQLLTAGAIAPAYANGAPWYSGMGWAFSGSGYAASNVVARTIFDGESVGLPDYYETRLLDLDFTVSFTGSVITALTAASGVAYANMAGHGFVEGALVSIFGATPDDYNGAHIIRNVTADSFEFTVESGIPSPASGSPQAANAAGVATITAALTTGTPGRVTFRWADLGTLWVPGSEQFTRWDGIRPFRNIFNCSGVVHVFYDGEEKVVTNWRSQTGTVAEERILSPHPDPSSPNYPLPAGADPNNYWAGVTFGFHYWASAPLYIDPYPQDNKANPDCKFKYADYVIGSGHLYSSYGNLEWGFSGPFNHIVNAYSRNRIETETHWYTDHIRDPGFDTFYNSGYVECGTSPPRSCAATFVYRAYKRTMVKNTARVTEGGSGSSALFLFPMEREAVGGVKRTSNTYATTNSAVGGNFLKSRIVTEHVIHAGFPLCNIAQFDIAPAGLPSVGPTISQPVVNTSSATKEFAIRASGGVSISGSIAGASADLDPFIVWQAGVKETADSSIFYMGGGLYNADPGLNPPDQTDNRVYSRDGVQSVTSGFTALPSGRTPVAFIGQV